jgi:hypothetical protein
MKFSKGQSGNPAGRPKGSKHKLTEAFWNDFAGAWETHGIQALQHVAENDPSTFVRVAASVMPKDLDVSLARSYVIRAPEPCENVEEWERQWSHGVN